MTERKPPDLPWESWIERKIREAQERGDFDDLPGAGKPIPGRNRPDDAYWWVKQLLQREELSVAPAVFELRRDVERTLEEIAAARSEAQVRRLVAELNERIAAFNARATAGPPSTVAPLDPDAAVRRWRADPPPPH